MELDNPVTFQSANEADLQQHACEGWRETCKGSTETRDQTPNGRRIRRENAKLLHVFQTSAAPVPICYRASSWC